MKKTLTMFAVTSAILLGSFSIASAQSVLYSQTNEATLGTTPRDGVTQNLGTGLTGVVDQWIVGVNFNSAAGASVYSIDFDECTSVSAGCTTVFTTLNTNQNITIAAGGETGASYIVSTSTGISLSPTKYYRLGVNRRSGTATARIIARGSGTSLYSGGDCFFSTVSDFGCSPVYDLRFSMSGVQTVADTSYTSLNWPTQASTTAQTSVNFNFSYHAVAVNNIDSYALLVTDLTQNNSFTITGTAATGDATISRTFTLTSGHTYNWTAYICAAGGSCYGGSTVQFSVVSSNFSIGVTGTNSTTSSPIGPGGYIPSPLILTSDNASSTIQSGLNSFLNIPQILSGRFPFNWFYEIGQLWDSLSATSTSAFYSYALNLHSLGIGSTTAMGNILPDWSFLSSTTISVYYPDSIRLTFRDILVPMAVWTTVAFYMLYRIRGLFK